MASKNQAWHVSNDSPDKIEMCLNCKRPQCVNCLIRPDAFDKDYYSKPRKKSKTTSTAIHVNGYRLNSTAQAVLPIYPYAKTDKEIGEAVGKSGAAVATIRYKLGLPSMHTLSTEERLKLVEKFLAKKDSDGVQT